ncbi:hypothetical protein PoB_000965100 [Plakobranchus ocellatus]|uniref:Uncharacterized protein n=1 Tax=Plakobranchus ocellatus TaxID=259542 RepID=A0AAV3YIS8_9GAST|nr:hypothetical protein PoB_000965100 [Plakobranchus ocellatus]
MPRRKADNRTCSQFLQTSSEPGQVHVATQQNVTRTCSSTPWLTIVQTGFLVSAILCFLGLVFLLKVALTCCSDGDTEVWLGLKLFTLSGVFGVVTCLTFNWCVTPEYISKEESSFVKLDNDWDFYLYVYGSLIALWAGVSGNVSKKRKKDIHEGARQQRIFREETALVTVATSASSALVLPRSLKEVVGWCSNKYRSDNPYRQHRGFASSFFWLLTQVLVFFSFICICLFHSNPGWYCEFDHEDLSCLIVSIDPFDYVKRG